MDASSDSRFLHEGAITRLYFKNFVTYSEVEILPEPGLNVVIGPNGSGKSTIVCGICLGLAGSPKVLGRQSTVLEFIKHGETNAVIEVELYNPDGAPYKIRREITREASNHSRWYLNGRLSNQKHVESFVISLGIQINNLTQFLPQDRVSDFARMNSKELLSGTQKAVNMQLFDDHEYLKTSWEKLKEYESRLGKVKEKLTTDRSTNAQLEQDVKTFELRQQHVSDLKMLNKKRPWLLYEERRSQFLVAKSARDKLQSDLQALKDVFAPLRNRHDDALKAEQALARDLRTLHEKAEGHFTLAGKERKKIEESKGKVEEAIDAFNKIKDAEAKRCRNVTDVNDQIRALQNQLTNISDHEDLQPAIDLLTKQLQEIGSQLPQIQASIDSSRRAVADMRREEQDVKRELQKLQDVNVQRLEDLRRVHNDTYKAVVWLRANKDSFKGVIHEPMMLTIQLLDAKDAKYLENTISNNDLRAFICENEDDLNPFLNAIQQELKLRGVNVFGTVRQSADSYQPRFPIEKYQRYGFRSYLRELFMAPEPVVRYLCAQYKVHSIPIGNEYTKSNVEAIMQSHEELTFFFTENERVSVKTSRYSSAKLTATSTMRESKVLNRSSFDHVREKSLQDQLQSIAQRLSARDQESQRLTQEMQSKERQEEQLRNEKKRLLDKKAEKRTLLQQIEMKNQTLKRLQNDRVDIIDEKHKLNEKLKNIQQKKGSCLKEMKNHLLHFNKIAFSKIRVSMRQATALKQLSVVAAELRDKESSVQTLEADLRRAEADANNAKDMAKKLLDEARKMSSLTGNQQLPPEIQQAFSLLPDTLDELDQQIHSVQTRINCITNIDSEVVRDFENRKQRIEEMEKEITELESKTARHRVETQVIHQRWFEPLKDVIEKISNKFSSYFSAMMCAGEVLLTIPANQEDYNEYGISIRVKFRDSEQLCELTPHHQSGGERSVSTVLYMVSLQDLTKCPFRCVDEINQGMDPINERAVFDLVVRTACTGTTSQYFLFTPKLLADLSYSERLAVLPVFNGTHSSFPNSWSLSNFARIRRTLEL